MDCVPRTVVVSTSKGRFNRWQSDVATHDRLMPSRYAVNATYKYVASCEPDTMHFPYTTTDGPSTSQDHILLYDLLIFRIRSLSSHRGLCSGSVLRISALHSQQETSRPVARPHDYPRYPVESLQLQVASPFRSTLTAGELMRPTRSQIDVTMILVEAVCVHYCLELDPEHERQKHFMYPMKGLQGIK